ncbi:MAG: hypothetical protein EBU90_20315 [Proteobacteria bacterium]|nr:hypothetical protein [Pseudomonadota bacterium]
MIKKNEIKLQAKQYKIKPKTKKELMREIEEHAGVEGEGIFDYLKPLHRMVKPRIRSSLHHAINKYGDMPMDYVEKYIEPYVGKESVKHMRRGVKSGLHHGIDKFGDYTGAYGVKGGRVDIGRAFKNLGRQVTRQVNDTSRQIGRQVNNTAKKIVDTANKGARVYRNDIRPIVGPALKQGVKGAIEYGLPALAVASGNPELVPVAGMIASQISDPATEMIGKTTGAYGMRGGGRLKSDYSLKLDHVHPAMNPQKQLQMVTSGGSFKQAGYGTTYRKYKK